MAIECVDYFIRLVPDGTVTTNQFGIQIVERCGADHTAAAETKEDGSAPETDFMISLQLGRNEWQDPVE